MKIPNVSVLTIGPALGHGIEIDRQGLTMALECLKRRGSVKLIAKHDGEFDDIVGTVTNFKIEGDKIKGDIELLESHPTAAARVLEIAKKIPTEFGLSIESFGGEGEESNGKASLFRPAEIDAIALVPRPAANPGGLFSSSLGRLHFSKRKAAADAESIATLKVSHPGSGAAAEAFRAKIAELTRLGVKNPVAVVALRHAGIYNAYRHEVEGGPAHLDGIEAVCKFMREPNPGIALMRLSREQPDLYNAARAAGKL